MKTALVIIDVQKSLIDEGPGNAENVLERIAHLISSARDAGAPVMLLASLGFEVVLVGEAHTTFDHEYLSAEQIVAHHNYILRRFPAGLGSVTVVESDNVVFT